MPGFSRANPRDKSWKIVKLYKRFWTHKDDGRYHGIVGVSQGCLLSPILII